MRCAGRSSLITPSARSDLDDDDGDDDGDVMMIVMMASVLVGQVSLHRAPDRIYLAAAICQPSLLAASENLRNVENLAF